MRRIARLTLGGWTLVWLACWHFSPTAVAQDITCADCHDTVVVSSPPHTDFECGICHSNVTGEHPMDDMAPLTDAESCALCHDTAHADVENSVHAGLATCGDCHGSAHEILPVADHDSPVSPPNQIETCGACHDAASPLIQGYVENPHGHGLLVSGLIDSATCNDCHGDHDILAADDEASPVSRGRSPEMCGNCHSLILDGWRTESAHGMAWEAGNTKAPTCTQCHDSHSGMSASTEGFHHETAENCGTCHERYYRTFREGFHGKADRLGLEAVANCASCHSPHANLPEDDPRSLVHPDNLRATCGNCHATDEPDGLVNQAFITYDPHNDPTDPSDNYPVYLVWFSMTTLLILVFSFFGLHDLLALQRTIVGMSRGEFKETHPIEGPWIRRFQRSSIRLHAVLVTTFLTLALTGLPLRFSHAEWAQNLIGWLGGVDFTRILHRLAAVATFGYATFHLAHLVIRLFVRRERGMAWGPKSLIPQPIDFFDLIANLRYFLYLGRRPENDRWNYIEKFDYFAVFWGVVIIGFSGLMLWFPLWFTGFLPGWAINAAAVIHSDEALLATCFIFIFHFFHTHVRPETFPMDTVIFTGRMPLGQFKAERPREYRRLVEEGQLEQHLAKRPNRRQRRRAYMIGTVFLTTGVLLAIGIISALLTTSSH